MHELRRPLQALTLLEDGAGPPPASPTGASRRGLLELVACALSELDRAVNGGAAVRAMRPVSCRELLLASLERWRPAAAGAGGFKVFWDAGPAVVEGDPVGMAQAFDNLIANALEHGGPPLVVTGAKVAGRLRITVANGGARRGTEPSERPASPPDQLPLLPRGPQRGHGVAVVNEIATAHRGRFALCRTGSGCVAALELPLADSAYARAA
jgi:light-regulated signal transduction histidine kinase (bacteriophytochrome)